MVKIDLAKTYIPVEIGDVELRFNLTDKAIVYYKRELAEVTKEIDRLSQDVNKQSEEFEDVEKSIEEFKTELKKAYDIFFPGQDGFNKIYPLVESVTGCYDMLIEIMYGIEAELDERKKDKKKKKVEKYIENKKKKK